MDIKDYSNEGLVLEKTDFFSNIQLWPSHRTLDPKGWLENFKEDEKYYATILLDFFCYINSDITDALFHYALNNISNYHRQNSHQNDSWELFCKKSYFTYVTGERPSPADSGYLFARKTRNVCGIEEVQILHHDDILRREKELQDGFLIFVDDFIGSGLQIITCLKSNRSAESLIDFCRRCKTNIIYSPLVTTEVGLQTIHKYLPDIIVLPAHILDDSYNVFSGKSLCWNGEIQSKGIQVIEAASRRANIPMADKNNVDYWKGFHELGLALSFCHCTPDATIPLFRWNKNNWLPLIRT